jgi:hypothetical protein
MPTIAVGVAAEIDSAGAFGTRVTSGWSLEASAQTFIGIAVVPPEPIHISGREPVTRVNGREPATGIAERRRSTVISRRVGTTTTQGQEPGVDCPECPPLG